jgi:hypothetical protein
MPKGLKKYTTTDFISTTQHGDQNFGRAEVLIRDLAEAADHHRDHNVLIDLRDTQGSLSFMELMSLSLELVQYRSAFRNKLAVVIPDRKDRIEKVEFFKAGLDLVGFQFEYFTDYEKAVAWMSEEMDLSDEVS